MAPFTKVDGNGGKSINWMRLLELGIIVAINAAVVVTTIQMKISFIEKTIERIEKVVIINDGRTDTLETQSAICMDRLNRLRH